MARNILPYAIFVPIPLAYFRLKGEELGWYETGFGVCLTVLKPALVQEKTPVEAEVHMRKDYADYELNTKL